MAKLLPMSFKTKLVAKFSSANSNALLDNIASLLDGKLSLPFLSQTDVIFTGSLIVSKNVSNREYWGRCFGLVTLPQY